MKTAVSLPDELFRTAEAAARSLRLSRSELYAKAIAQFLQSRRENSITQRLDDLYATHSAEVDASLHDAQVKSLEHDS